MSKSKPTYRIEIKSSGTSPDDTYEWEIYRNFDVLPVLRSRQTFSSRRAGVADAYRTRRQLVETELPR